MMTRRSMVRFDSQKVPCAVVIPLSDYQCSSCILRDKQERGVRQRAENALHRKLDLVFVNAKKSKMSPAEYMTHNVKEIVLSFIPPVSDLPEYLTSLEFGECFN
jgi:hypothetical protein